MNGGTKRGGWTWLLLAGAILVAAGASIGWWRARGEAARLQDLIAGLQTASERNRVSAVLSADDVRRVSLQGIGPAGQARAQVYFSASRGMVLAAENLPELPPDRVYQVWAISGDSPVSAGTFQRERDGRGSLIALSQIPPPNAMAITVEPTGGVPLPTGPKYLQGLAE